MYANLLTQIGNVCQIKFSQQPLSGKTSVWLSARLISQKSKGNQQPRRIFIVEV